MSAEQHALSAALSYLAKPPRYSIQALMCLHLCLVWEGCTCRACTLKHQVSDITTSQQFNYLRDQVIKNILLVSVKLNINFLFLQKSGVPPSSFCTSKTLPKKTFWNTGESGLICSTLHCPFTETREQWCLLHLINSRPIVLLYQQGNKQKWIIWQHKIST